MSLTHFKWAAVCFTGLSFMVAGCSGSKGGSAENGAPPEGGGRKSSNATETDTFQHVTTFSVEGIPAQMIADFETHLQIGVRATNDNGKLSCQVIRDHEKLPKDQKWKSPMKIFAVRSADQKPRGAFAEALTFLDEDLERLTLKVNFFYKGRTFLSLWRLKATPTSDGKCQGSAELCINFVNRGGKSDCATEAEWRPIHDVRAQVTVQNFQGVLQDLKLQFYQLNQAVDSRASNPWENAPLN